MTTPKEFNPRVDFVTLESIKGFTLDQSTYFVRQGIISQELFDAYCHLWQTSVPRFAVQACHCPECLKSGPASI